MTAKLERLQPDDETKQQHDPVLHTRQQQQARMVSGLVLNQKLVRRVIKQQENRGCEHQQLITLFPSNLSSCYCDVFHYVQLRRPWQGEFGARLSVRDFCRREWVVLGKGLEILM